jgi:hypothetical protein
MEKLAEENHKSLGFFNKEGASSSILEVCVSF